MTTSSTLAAIPAAPSLTPASAAIAQAARVEIEVERQRRGTRGPGRFVIRRARGGLGRRRQGRHGTGHPSREEVRQEHRRDHQAQERQGDYQAGPMTFLQLGLLSTSSPHYTVPGGTPRTVPGERLFNLRRDLGQTCRVAVGVSPGQWFPHKRQRHRRTGIRRDLRRICVVSARGSRNRTHEHFAEPDVPVPLQCHGLRARRWLTATRSRGRCDANGSRKDSTSRRRSAGLIAACSI